MRPVNKLTARRVITLGLLRIMQSNRPGRTFLISYDFAMQKQFRNGHCHFDLHFGSRV